MATLKAGDKAPAFRLPADDGSEVKLADYHGKNVVLFFFPKALTPG
jgi:peroxiredoxin Q/BCP